MIVVYLYNFAVLPLERSPMPRYLLEIVLNFLNLGLAGFVIASIAARFVFPGVSLEGNSFWLLKKRAGVIETLPVVQNVRADSAADGARAISGLCQQPDTRLS